VLKKITSQNVFLTLLFGTKLNHGSLEKEEVAFTFYITHYKKNEN